MPSERRRNARLGLAIPLRVQGYLGDGNTWEEFSTTDDVSLGGACFPLSHDVELGQILFLTLPLPKRLRQFDLTEESYRIYTLVRSVRRRPDRSRVGVMYFGKYPPRGFHDRPGARYLLPSDDRVTRAPAGGEAPPSPSRNEDPDALPPRGQSPARRQAAPPPTAPPPGPPEDAPPVFNWGTTIPTEPRPAVPPPPSVHNPAPEFHPPRAASGERRAFPRFEVFVNFVIQQVDEWGTVLQEELTVADNVSRGGVRVMTTLSFAKGTVVLLREAGGGFATRAEVRGITEGQPSTGRLHLRFLDRQAPERLLRS